jgi:hypothetical protein
MELSDETRVSGTSSDERVASALTLLMTPPSLARLMRLAATAATVD